jgi:Sec-independent protein translocase protein TatA
VEQIVNKNWSQAIIAILVVLFLTASPVRACARYSSRGYSGFMAQARQSYQQQMKQQAAEQKAIMQAEQQAIAIQAAEEKRKHDAHVKANRARIDRDAQRREAMIAKRKAEMAAKAGSVR